MTPFTRFRKLAWYNFRAKILMHRAMRTNNMFQLIAIRDEIELLQAKDDAVRLSPHTRTNVFIRVPIKAIVISLLFLFALIAITCGVVVLIIARVFKNILIVLNQLKNKLLKNY